MKITLGIPASLSLAVLLLMTPLAYSMKINFSRTINLQYHQAVNPEIVKPKDIDVILHRVENNTDNDIVVSSMIREIIHTIPALHSAKICIPLHVAALNRLFTLPAPIGSIKDGLEAICFTNADDSFIQPERPYVYLSPWINKTTNRLEGTLLRMDKKEIKFPLIENQIPLGIDNAKKYFISLILAGQDFKDSRVLIAQKGNHAGKKSAC